MVYYIIVTLLFLREMNTMGTDDDQRYLSSFGIFVSALEYIENNLCADFGQEDIAAACFCSLSKLQKLWKYCAHISIKEYITKRKLTLAGRDLIEKDLTVLDAAMKYGYNSHEVFTRAFTKVWGLSPSRFKKEWKGSCGLYPRLNPEYLPEGELIMSVKKFDVSEFYDYLKTMEGTYVLCFDIVGLHAVNRDIGREAGDKMILESLRRINETAAEEETVAFRMGSDEFVMITGLNDPDKVRKVGKRILDHNGESVPYSGGSVEVSLRAGAFMIQKPLRYTALCKGFDTAISKARSTSEIEFV